MFCLSTNALHAFVLLLGVEILSFTENTVTVHAEQQDIVYVWTPSRRLWCTVDHFDGSGINI